MTENWHEAIQKGKTNKMGDKDMRWELGDYPSTNSRPKIGVCGKNLEKWYY